MIFNQFLVIGSMVVVFGWLLFLWYYILKSVDFKEKIIWLLVIIAAISIGMIL